MENITTCPGCSSTNLQPFGKANDWLVSKEYFKIDQCSTCGLKFTNPRPEENQLGKYYESDEYISHTDEKKGLVPTVYRKARELMLQKKLNLLKQHHPKAKTVLDIGCGTGHFLRTLEKNGIEPTGMEPSPSARTIAQSNSTRTVHATLDEVTGTYDVITLWHVLEHLPNLQSDLKKIHTLLQPDGVLIIAVPNPESKDAEMYGLNWAAYDVPRHLYHFSKNSLSHILNQFGFVRTKIHNMPLDAYYVSLLSEKNQKSRLALPKAVLNGFRSNLSGMRTKNQSSLIHVFKKAQNL